MLLSRSFDCGRACAAPCCFAAPHDSVLHLRIPHSIWSYHTASGHTQHVGPHVMRHHTQHRRTHNIDAHTLSLLMTHCTAFFAAQHQQHRRPHSIDAHTAPTHARCCFSAPCCFVAAHDSLHSIFRSAASTASNHTQLRRTHFFDPPHLLAASRTQHRLTASSCSEPHAASTHRIYRTASSCSEPHAASTHRIYHTASSCSEPHAASTTHTASAHTQHQPTHSS